MADIKEKWTIGPQSFEPTYELPKGIHLYETLQYLCRRRNAFVHYKIKLEVEGDTIFDGSKLDRLSFQGAQEWINKFLRLPYDLHAHACGQ